jgi:hypothetical protein
MGTVSSRKITTSHITHNPAFIQVCGLACPRAQSTRPSRSRSNRNWMCASEFEYLSSSAHGCRGMCSDLKLVMTLAGRTCTPRFLKKSRSQPLCYLSYPDHQPHQRSGLLRMMKNRHQSEQRPGLKELLVLLSLLYLEGIDKTSVLFDLPHIGHICHQIL